MLLRSKAGFDRLPCEMREMREMFATICNDRDVEFSAPVEWDELTDVDCSNVLSIGDAERLLKRAKGARLSGWGQARQQLPRLG